jgi:hypothetical protein
MIARHLGMVEEEDMAEEPTTTIGAIEAGEVVMHIRGEQELI